MVGIRIAETVPVFPWRYRPALGLIYLLGLPDIKEPAVGLFTQPLYLFTEMQRALYRAVNQPFTRVAAQHRRSRLDRSDDRVTWRGRGMHHKGFVKGVFVVVALDVN